MEQANEQPRSDGDFRKRLSMAVTIWPVCWLKVSSCCTRFMRSKGTVQVCSGAWPNRSENESGTFGTGTF